MSSFCILFVCFFFFVWLSCIFGDEAALGIPGLLSIELWDRFVNLFGVSKLYVESNMVVEKFGMPQCRQTQDKLLASMTL